MADLPGFWSAASQALAADDPVMADLVARYQGMGLVSRGDAFATLARSIIGQQISVKAADSVWARFSGAVGAVTPAGVAAQGRTGLVGCGLSQRKIEYLADLAEHFLAGRIEPQRWSAASDEAIIAELCDVRGIGRWTAEMFLIFHLTRPDVFPLADLGLQKAVALLYLQGERPTPRALAAWGERWRPWRSVATWYLWRSLDPVPVAY